MKRIVFLSMIFALFFVNVHGQTDSLSYKNGFWKSGDKLSKSAVKELMLNDSKALAKFKSAQTNEVIGYIIGCPSAYAFGYDLGTRFGGGEGNSKLLLVGGIGTVVGLIFSFTAESNYKQSAIIFNKGGNRDKAVSTVDFGFTSSGGIGFTLRF